MNVAKVRIIFDNCKDLDKIFVCVSKMREPTIEYGIVA